jgi:hypothetical protein
MPPGVSVRGSIRSSGSSASIATLCRVAQPARHRVPALSTLSHVTPLPSGGSLSRISLAQADNASTDESRNSILCARIACPYSMMKP